MNPRLDALQKLPGLKGPALSIMMALMIAQRPLLAYELEDFTGYENQAVSRGLRKLRTFRAVIHLGKGTGYILTPLWRQLVLPLNHENHDLVGVNHENHDLHVPSSNSGSSGYKSNSDLLPTNQEAGQNHENHDLPVDNSVNSGEITPRHAAPEITARSGSPEITAVAYWLNEAGISPGSFHWGKIIGMGHSESHVKAHVLELLAGQEGIPGAEAIKTGALIYRLEHGWKSPVMRCEDCLRIERECRCKTRIPAEYEGIIKQ